MNKEEIEIEIMEHNKIMINSKVTDNNHQELLIKDARLNGKLKGFNIGFQEGIEQTKQKFEKIIEEWINNNFEINDKIIGHELPNIIKIRELIETCPICKNKILWENRLQELLSKLKGEKEK